MNNNSYKKHSPCETEAIRYSFSLADESVQKSATYRLFLSARLLMLILIFFGSMITTATFYILNYSLVCMIDPKYLVYNDVNNNNSIESSGCNLGNYSNESGSMRYNGSYQWDKSQQSTILAGESWGSIWFVFAAGYFMDKYGARYLFGFANLLLGTITVLIPFVSPFGWQWCFIARILQGIGMLFTWPATFVLASTWFPAQELGRAVVASAAGFEIGGLISEGVAGYLCGTFLGWKMSFYLFGSLALVYAVIWFVVYRDSIDGYLLMSKQEQIYIAGKTDKGGKCEKSDVNKNENIVVAWKSMFTSIQLFSLTIINMTGGYAAYFITDYTPQYLDSVLKISNPAKSGLYSALPFIFSLAGGQIVGPFSDWLELKISRTSSMKVISVIAVLISCISLGLIPVFTCKSSGYAVAMFSISFFGYGLSFGGYFKNIGQLAPTYSGMIAGIATTALYVGGILAPYVTAAVTKKNSAAEWHMAIFITVAINFVGLAQFVILGSGEIQNWDPSFEQKEENDCLKLSNKLAIEVIDKSNYSIIKL